MSHILNLDRTRAALQKYDAELGVPLPEDFDEAWEKYCREDALAREVGEAFSLDTTHINDPAVSKMCRPGRPKEPDHPDESFIRRMVRLY